MNFPGCDFGFRHDPVGHRLEGGRAKEFDSCFDLREQERGRHLQRQRVNPALAEHVHVQPTLEADRRIQIGVTEQ